MTSEKIKETPIAIEARNGNRAQPGERLPLIRAAFEPIAVDLQVRQPEILQPARDALTHLSSHQAVARPLQRHPRQRPLEERHAIAITHLQPVNRPSPADAAPMVIAAPAATIRNALRPCRGHAARSGAALGSACPCLHRFQQVPEPLAGSNQDVRWLRPLLQNHGP